MKQANLKIMMLQVCMCCTYVLRSVNPLEHLTTCIWCGAVSIQEQLESYQKKEPEWLATKATLEQTLEELMNNFDTAMTDFTKEKNQAVATISLMDTDISRVGYLYRPHLCSC